MTVRFGFFACVSYLLLGNKLPPKQWLKTTILFAHDSGHEQAKLVLDGVKQLGSFGHLIEVRRSYIGVHHRSPAR